MASAKTDTLFSVAAPGTGMAGGRFRVRAYAQADGVAPAVYIQEFAIAAAAGAAKAIPMLKGKGASAPEAGQEAGWGTGTFTLAGDGSGRVAHVRFATVSPKGAANRVDVELEYETWGQVRVK